jgi:hypothetical protein
VVALGITICTVFLFQRQGYTVLPTLAINSWTQGILLLQPPKAGGIKGIHQHASYILTFHGPLRITYELCYQKNVLTVCLCTYPSIFMLQLLQRYYLFHENLTRKCYVCSEQSYVKK